MNSIARMVSVSLVLFPLACAPKPSPSAPAEPAPASASVDAPDTGEGVAWADKSMKQKGAFMKVEVVPAVAEIWKQSPESDEMVTCATCHGAGARKGEFTMPNAGLPVLDPTNNFEAHSHDAAWLEFMGKQLTPRMTELLGVAPYDMETHQGFGCFSCHTKKGS